MTLAAALWPAVAPASLSPLTLGMGDVSLGQTDVLSGWANPAGLGRLAGPLQVAAVGGVERLHDGPVTVVPAGLTAAGAVGAGWTVAGLWRLDERRPAGGSFAPADNEEAVAAGWGWHGLAAGVSVGRIAPPPVAEEVAVAAQVAGRYLDAGVDWYTSLVPDGTGGTVTGSSFIPGAAVHDADRRWFAALELVDGARLVRGGVQARLPVGADARRFVAVRAGGLLFTRQPAGDSTATAGASVGGPAGAVDYGFAVDRWSITHLLGVTAHF